MRRTMNRLTLLLIALVVMALAAPSYADLIAYEPFDYAQIGEELVGNDGGTGFSGAWRGWEAPNHNNLDIVEGSLTFPGLQTHGNRITSPTPYFTTWSAAARSLETRVLRDETTTKYFSFLVQPKGTAGEGVSNGVLGTFLARIIHKVWPICRKAFRWCLLSSDYLNHRDAT